MDQQSMAPKQPTNPVIWVVLAVVMVALGVGGYYYTQNNGNTNTSANENFSPNTNTTIDTSDWKTYENEEIKARVNRPASWQFIDYPYLDGTYYRNYSLGDTTRRDGDIYVQMYAEPDYSVPEGLSNEEALRYEVGRGSGPVVSEHFFTVNALPTYRRIEQTTKNLAGEEIQPMVTSVRYTYRNKSLLYRYILNIYSNSPQQIIDLFDQSARTFQLGS